MLFFICLLFKLLLITGESIYFTSLSGFKMFPIKQTLEHRLPSFDPPQHFYDVFKTKLQGCGAISNGMCSGRLQIQYCCAIVGFRSAISAYHVLIQGISVGKHPKGFELLTSIFNNPPPSPKPKCNFIWDVKKGY